MLFLVELIASSFLDLISKQARLKAAVRAFLLLIKWNIQAGQIEPWIIVTSQKQNMNFLYQARFFSLYARYIWAYSITISA